MRKVLITVLVLGLLAAAAVGGREGYRNWKTNRAVAQAKIAVGKSDYKKALFWLRSALQRNGNSIEAVRMMGDFAELSQSPELIYWRNRLVELQPDSITNRVLLARVAVVNRDYPAAKRALDGIRPGDRGNPEALQLAGVFAVATGRFQEAETNFQAAATSEPSNPIPLLNLAIIRVQRKDPQIAGEARQILERFRTNEVVRNDALRQLTLDAVRHTNLSRALVLARELASRTNALLNDRLLELDVMRDARSPQLRPALAALQRELATNAPAVFGVGRWMMAAMSPHETHAWLQSVSPQIQTNLPVTMLMADTFLAASNWTALEGWVGKQQWGEMDHLRLAFSSRAMRERNLANAAKAEWSKSVRLTESRLDRLTALEHLAVAWNWPVEVEEILWLVVNKFPSEKGAVQSLSSLLYLTGKTRSFLTLMAQETRLNPKDLGVKNNLASLAMLLNAQEHKPYELAREVYEMQPDNPSFASTYAYSLYLQKKPREALQVMDRFKPEQLEDPGIAGYYGLILAAASGDMVRAKKCLDISAKSRLLPEEAQLFQRVRW